MTYSLSALICEIRALLSLSINTLAPFLCMIWAESTNSFFAEVEAAVSMPFT